MNDLYETCLLLFLETAPQSNKYHQVYLSPEEFKRVSFSFGTVTNEVGDNQDVELRMSEDTYDFPDLPAVVEEN